MHMCMFTHIFDVVIATVVVCGLTMGTCVNYNSSPPLKLL